MDDEADFVEVVNDTVAVNLNVVLSLTNSVKEAGNVIDVALLVFAVVIRVDSVDDHDDELVPPDTTL